MVTRRLARSYLTLESEKLLQVPSALANSKLERLLALGREINDTRSKIRIATDQLGKEWSVDIQKEGVEDLVLAREALRGDLELKISEARGLIPVVEELVANFEEQMKRIENGKKLHQGLARIEEIRGDSRGAIEHKSTAGKRRIQILELQNLIAALGDLKRDVTSRREVISCPRCSSYDLQYTITPSELGFSLYKCNRCSNAWRVQHFSIQIG